MPTRTVKLYGKVYGSSTEPATLTVNWDGQQIYSGTVATSSDPLDPRVVWADLDELGTWTMDTSVSGYRPLSLTIENGSMVFHTLHANYLGNITQGNVVIPTESAFKDLTGPSTAESDGYDQTMIDGVPVSRDPVTEAEAIGKWNWIFYADSTFTCQANVQPAVLV